MIVSMAHEPFDSRCPHSNLRSPRKAPEKICNQCLRALPRVFCAYCKKDFHLLNKDSGKVRCVCRDLLTRARAADVARSLMGCTHTQTPEQQWCPSCAEQHSLYGRPRACAVCTLPCAFKYATQSAWFHLVVLCSHARSHF